MACGPAQQAPVRGLVEFAPLCSILPAARYRTGGFVLLILFQLNEVLALLAQKHVSSKAIVLQQAPTSSEALKPVQMLLLTRTPSKQTHRIQYKKPCRGSTCGGSLIYFGPGQVGLLGHSTSNLRGSASAGAGSCSSNSRVRRLCLLQQPLGYPEAHCAPLNRNPVPMVVDEMVMNVAGRDERSIGLRASYDYCEQQTATEFAQHEMR
jgi:hypothetical protein